MTQRADHAAVARRIIRHVSKTALSAKSAAVMVAGAQVHATLALVEQQRIANLIALTDHAHERFGNYAGEAGGMGVLFSYGETPESNIRLRADIREGLGL